MTLLAQPGRNYWFNFTTAGLILDEKSDVKLAKEQHGDLEAFLKIQMRKCNEGEAFLSTGECEECREGRYLWETQISNPTDCRPCPHNAICFGGKQIGPKAGFWRSGPHSLEFFSCLNSAACLGAVERTEFKGRCAPDYQGVMCSQCEPGYSRNSRFECSRCPSLAVNLTVTIVGGVLAVAAMCLFVWLSLRS